MARYLLVAYQTAEAPELLDAVGDAAARDPEARFILLVPATPVRHLLTWTRGESAAAARAKGDQAAARLRQRGIALEEVRIGDPDPYVAVADELRDDPDYQGIILSTFPPGISRWLRLDLPSRLEQGFGLPVVHVVAEPAGTSS